jgi:hypothetical protein
MTDHVFVWRADSMDCSVCGEPHSGCEIVKVEPEGEQPLPELTDAQYIEKATEFLEQAAKMNNVPVPYMIAAAFKNEHQLSTALAQLAQAKKELADRDREMEHYRNSERTLAALEEKFPLAPADDPLTVEGFEGEYEERCRNGVGNSILDYRRSHR